MRLARLGWAALLGGCFTDPPPASEDTSSGSATATSTTDATDSTGGSPDTGATTTSTSDTAESADTATTAPTSSTTSEPTELVVYSLFEELCNASIDSYPDADCGDCAQPVECDAVTTPAGHAVRISEATLEGVHDGYDIIELATIVSDTAFITAHFDGIQLVDMSAPRLRGTMWCSDDPTCHSWWQIEVVIVDPVNGDTILDSIDGEQMSDGEGAEVDLDLAAAGSASLRVTLRMSNHGDVEEGDRIRFEHLRIVALQGE